MGLIRYDGVDDYLKWATIAAALGSVPSAAWTYLFGVRHASLSGYQGYGYLLSGTGVGSVQGGVSKHNNNDIFMDVGAAPAWSTFDPAIDQDILYVFSKAAGSAVPNGSKKIGSAGSWLHSPAGNSFGNRLTPAVQMQFGAWQAADPFNGWEAVVAIWNVELSQAQREACGANWRTSDIWDAHSTKPLVLMQLNAAAASLINLGTASIADPAHVGTTLDAAQTFDGWNFNGIGGVVPDTDNFFNFI